MTWNKIRDVAPPIGRPLHVRTIEADEPVIAFLSEDGVWFKGGALVHTGGTMLGATPTEWCETDSGVAL